MRDTVEWAAFLRWALPRLRLDPGGFPRVHRRVRKQVSRRLRGLGLGSLAAYRAHLEATPGEWRLLDGLCRVVVSRFHRDAACFDRLRGQVLPRLCAQAARAGRPYVDAWSAGCACGEEPWTLRILWDLHVAPAAAGVALRVLASDADERVLARARRAVYPPSSLRAAPRAWRSRVFSAVEGGFLLSPAHRHGVEFVRQDLRRELPDGPFDLILCRNLAFTYFDDGLRAQVAAAMRARLRDGGEIVVGAHEQLPGDCA